MANMVSDAGADLECPTDKRRHGLRGRILDCVEALRQERRGAIGESNHNVTHSVQPIARNN